MRKETGAMGLAALVVMNMAATKVGKAEVNPTIVPDPIIEGGEMASQKEIDLVGQKERETVDQRFADFLAGEGELSDYMINQRTMSFSEHDRDLGYFSNVSDYGYEAQGILLHYEDGENGQYLAIGLKDRDGKRKVAIVEFPTKLLEGLPGFGVNVYDRGTLKSRDFQTENEAKLFLDSVIGNMFIMGFLVKDYNRTGLDTVVYKYLDYLESKSRISLEFADDLLMPDKKSLFTGDRKIIDQLAKINSHLESVNSLSEMLTKIENYKKIPVTFGITYNINEY